jgi:hypothetical protein
MSHLGAPPLAPAPAPPPPEHDTSGVPGWVLGVAALVALAMVGALTYAVLGGAKTDAPPAAARHHRHYPKHWDRRIAPYARIAAKERGLRFHHPVPVRFLTPAAFAKSLRTDDKDVSKADRREMEQTTALLRAFGLLSGNVDLVHAVNDFSGSAVLAYYSFQDKRITVRGHRITPSVRSTLVHELTHALQDQHFHISRRFKAMDKQARKGPTTNAADVLHALVEGDAERVEGLYRASLTPAQVRALDAAQQAEVDHAQPALDKIPKIVVTMLSSPYTLGEGLAQAASAAGGNRAVDRLLRETPTHDIALLDPLDAVRDPFPHTADVPVPALTSGEKEFDSGDFGALTWYLLLAARIAPKAALAAADGWGGDAFVAYHDSTGTACATMTYAGRTAADTRLMTTALRQWVAAGSSADAQVSTAGGRVSLQSCDPGTGVRSGNDDSDQAVKVAAVRIGLAVGLIRHGVPDSSAECMARKMVQTFPVTALVSPTFGVNDTSVQASLQQMALACR